MSAEADGPPPQATAPASSVLTEHQHELERQIVQAFRALLRTPLMSSDTEEFALVRRYHEVLVQRFRHLLGYELVLRGTHARLRKQPVAVDATRPMRVRQPKVHQDRWRAFTRRHYVLFALALAALDRAGPQTTIAMLAEEVVSLAREEGVALDLENRAHRRTLAEAVTALEHLGVLRVVDGATEVWVNASRQGEITLYDVEHGMLADLLVCRTITACDDAAGVVAAADDYPPTVDGANRRARHRVARRLVEGPVVYLSDLSAEEHEYYVGSQRPHIEARLAESTGWQIERRAEGTALVEPAAHPRALTDLRFPDRLAERQAGLLLCEPLTRAHYEGQTPVTRAALLRCTRELVERYHAHWGRHNDGESVALLLDEALSVLSQMRLVRVDGDLIEPLPAVARFSGVEVVDPLAPSADGSVDEDQQLLDWEDTDV